MMATPVGTTHIGVAGGGHWAPRIQDWYSTENRIESDLSFTVSPSSKTHFALHIGDEKVTMKCVLRAQKMYIYGRTLEAELTTLPKPRSWKCWGRTGDHGRCLVRELSPSLHSHKPAINHLLTFTTLPHILDF